MSNEQDVDLSMAEVAFLSSDHYHDLRPKYPKDAIKFMYKKAGLFPEDPSNTFSKAIILELGCGTGLFTKNAIEVLKENALDNVQYIASDPVESMRKTFSNSLPGVDIISCTAENIPFPDNSVKLIVAAASICWFANQQAYREMHRVLAPDGIVGFIALWPTITNENRHWLPEIHRHIYATFKENEAPLDHFMEWKKELDKSQLFGEVEKNFDFLTYQKIDQRQCVKFFSSWGGIAVGGESRVKKFEDALDRILCQNFSDKGIEFEGLSHTTEMYISKPKK